MILRKAFGGAFITMNSKDLGADYVFAWPQAEIGVMGAKPAVGIIHRRELAAAEDPETAREELAERYAETHLRPQVAAASGHIDELIEPEQTRAARCLGAPLAARASLSARRTRIFDRRDRFRRDGGARALPGARQPRSVTCLVRAESDEAARERLDGILDELIANGAELFEHRSRRSPAS